MHFNVLAAIGLAVMTHCAALPVADVGFTPSSELQNRQAGLAGILGIVSVADQCGAGLNTIDIGSCISTDSLTTAPATQSLTDILGNATGLLGTALSVLSMGLPPGTEDTGPLNIYLYPNADCDGEVAGFFEFDTNQCYNIFGVTIWGVGFAVGPTGSIFGGLPIVGGLLGGILKE